MDGTDLNNIRTVNYNINFDASLLHLLLLHLLHDGHSQLLHLDHGEVGKGKNVFLSSGPNLLPVGLGALHENLEAENRNGNDQQRLNALNEHLERFSDEEPLELVTHGLITDSWQISPVLWWRRRINLLNLYDIFHFRLLRLLLLKAPNASSATLAESVPRDADDGHQNEDIGADTHHCREPGVAVHEVPQTSQVGLYVKGGARNFDQLGLHLDMELTHWSMRIRVKGGKEGDWDALLLLSPANHKTRCKCHSLDATQQRRAILGNGRFAGSSNGSAVLPGDVHAGHKHAQPLIVWRVWHFQHHLDTVHLALEHLLLATKSYCGCGEGAPRRGLTFTRLKLEVHRHVNQLDRHICIVESAVEEDCHSKRERHRQCRRQERGQRVAVLLKQLPDIGHPVHVRTNFARGSFARDTRHL